MSKTSPKLAILGSFLALLVGGCDESSEPTFEDEARANAPGEPKSPPAGAQSLQTPRVGASAVRVMLDGSVISPWCSGVLVAPDVVLTATSCVEGRGGHRLSTGSTTGEVVGVDSVETLHRDERLSALVLETPPRGVEPADVVELTTERCDVHSLSYLFVPTGEPVEWWTWSGCYTPQTHALSVVDGAPNCHGDAGAPAYAGSDGLVGVVVGSTVEETCVNAVVLAGPESGAFEEAMSLSRPQS